LKTKNLLTKNNYKINIMKRIIGILLFVFPLIVCAQSSYYDYNMANKETLFYDDFSDNRNAWWSGDNYTPCSVEYGHYSMQRNTTGAAASWQTKIVIDEAKDFEIESNIKIAVGESQGFVNGLMWGKQSDQWKYYVFGYNDNNKYVVAKFAPDWTTLKTWTTSDYIRKNSYNKFTVRKVGGMYYFFINENLMYSTVYEFFYGQQLGFHIAPSATIWFDDIKVSYLNKVVIQNTIQNTTDAPMAPKPAGKK